MIDCDNNSDMAKLRNIKERTLRSKWQVTLIERIYLQVDCTIKYSNIKTCKVHMLIFCLIILAKIKPRVIMVPAEFTNKE